MLGMVFFILRNEVERLLGPSGWSHVLSVAKLPAKAYSPVADYPDSEATSLFGAVSRLVGQPLPRFLEEFGAALAPELLALHSGLVRPEWKTLDVLMNAEEVIHAVVRRRNPQAKPPVLRCARFADNEVQLVYASPRQLCEIAKGIVRGLAQHYQENISVTEQACMHVGDPFCAIQIRLGDSETSSGGWSELASSGSSAAADSMEGQSSAESPASKFAAMWRADAPPPDLRSFLQSAGALNAEKLSHVLCVDQRERWLRGERPAAESYLKLYRESQPRSEYAVDILYTEFLLRHQIGEAPSEEEYRQRFPDLIEQLRNQISLSRALGHPAAAADRASVSHLTAPIPDSSKQWPPLPGYEIVGELGRGGMGIVCKARQLSLNRIVAIKVVATNVAADAGIIARFDRERRLLAQLTHPNLVVAYDAGQAADVHYFVMEFVDGVSLAVLVRQRGTLPVAETCEIIRQTALGLQHIHEHGLVHRDIKPSNLLLSASGTVKIIDLGLARFGALPTQVDNLTTYRQLLGTVDYIAPEQCEDSHSVDIRADIYSLGCTMYELLAGRAPFAAAGSMLTKIKAHAADSVRPVREQRSDVPEQLVHTMERMLAKNRNDRFAIPAEVAAALLPFTSGADAKRLL
jgi:Protein kinase domain/Haem-NO-binding